MLRLEVISSERKLELPIYRLSEKKTRQKSCFIDRNRIDTVKSAKNLEMKKQNGLTPLAQRDKD